jgi:uncharacterized protein (DUF58 family)
MSITGLAGMLNIKGLTPELLPPEEVYAGVVTPFKLRIHNTKRFLPSFLIRADCEEGHGVTIPLLPRSASVTRDVALTFPRRGHAVIRQVTVSSPFPVSFFTRYWILPSEKTFVVFPHLTQGSAFGDGLEARQSGISIRHDRGLDGELERISIYSGREPLRMIHWKLSARGNDLLVKEFGRQAATPLIIDLDKQYGQNLEERISRAAWLVRRWVRERPVGLKLDTRTIPSAAGHRHGLKLLTELALYGFD